MLFIPLFYYYTITIIVKINLNRNMLKFFLTYSQPLDQLHRAEVELTFY